MTPTEVRLWEYVIARLEGKSEAEAAPLLEETGG